MGRLGAEIAEIKGKLASADGGSSGDGGGKKSGKGKKGAAAASAAAAPVQVALTEKDRAEYNALKARERQATADARQVRGGGRSPPL